MHYGRLFETRMPRIIPGIFLRGIPPPHKKTFKPQTAAKLCPLNLSFGRENELQIYHQKLSSNGQYIQEIIHH